MRRLAVVTLLVLLVLPAPAWGHARLVDTEPARGAALERSPQRVTLRFDEPVETSFGSVRVFDSRGGRVDSGQTAKPAADRVSVGLREDLADGAYTATFRVVSADSHPVTGGFIFTVGDSGGASAASVADLVDSGGSGPVTSAAFGVARATAYLATALLAGGLLFIAFVWARALAGAAGGSREWRLASEGFASRARLLLGGSAGAGALACAAGIVLQGATAAGTSAWAALDSGVLHDVLATRFGGVWAVRLSAFALLGALVALPAGRARVPVLRPASLGADGLAPSSPLRGAPFAVGALAAAWLVVAPALAGHAGVQDPAMLLVPLDVAHVAAMSAWVGGIALLLACLPAATRRLEGPDRSRLLAGALSRFSGLALASVAVLLATGIWQSILHLGAFSELIDEAYGRAILVKSAVFVALVGIGAHNRRASLPRLRRIAEDGGAPSGAGRTLRRVLRAELALMAAAIGVTAALVSYAPPSGAAEGPFSAARDLGPARLEMTVEPARIGRNEIHVYLFDSRTGAQYDAAKRLSLSAVLPERSIGPLPLEARRTGPGHFTARGADLLPGGEWRLRVRAPISDFEDLTADIEVPIR